MLKLSIPGLLMRSNCAFAAHKINKDRKERNNDDDERDGEDIALAVGDY